MGKYQLVKMQTGENKSFITMTNNDEITERLNKESLNV